MPLNIVGTILHFLWFSFSCTVRILFSSCRTGLIMTHTENSVTVGSFLPRTCFPRAHFVPTLYQHHISTDLDLCTMSARALAVDCIRNSRLSLQNETIRKSHSAEKIFCWFSSCGRSQRSARYHLFIQGCCNWGYACALARCYRFLEQGEQGLL